MKLKLLLCAAATASLAWTSAGFAAPPGDREHGRDQGQNQAAPAQDHPADQADTSARPARPARGEAPGRLRGQGQGMGQGMGQGQAHAPAAVAQPVAPTLQPRPRQTQTHPHTETHGQTPTGILGAPAGPFGGQPTVQHPARGVHPGRQGPTAQPAPPRFPSPTGVNRPGRPPALGDWSRPSRGPDRDQAGQQWRQGHQGWDRSAPWRRNNDWWRGNAAFRLFFGPRIGFFFIPGHGYVRAPDQYREHYWIAGEYLPNWFWQYPVRDYASYGLPDPPYGCMWVWVDNDIALIDRDDGYILDIVHNAW
ncbi:RcnB family protein [Caulobacter sp. KR2-114]|uniref:RcnB family protein n=1 Tax=Caulobacter sp. KR2-114 TaxID=3400912 RepID=UPI003C01ECFC